MKVHEVEFDSNYLVESCPCEQPASKDKKSPFFNISQRLERVAVRTRFFSAIYFFLFYKSMLQRELENSGLKPGAKVLHIGSGPSPYTALFLGRKGFKVDAIDCDNCAVREASLVVRQNGMEDSIKVVCGDGCTFKQKKYDAVWVSLNVYPKGKVLRQALGCLKDGGVLVYRNLPRWLSTLSKQTFKNSWPEGFQTSVTGRILGTESVLVRKGQCCQ